MANNIYFEIQADDVNRAADFYVKIFGWELIQAPQVPIPYIWVNTGSTMGGILQRPVAAPAPGQGTNAFVCSFEVADFDAAAAKILGAGGIVALPKFGVPKICWQGYFLDTEGNTFGIFQPDENAG
ncbi:VOC family protein [Chitinophaga sp. Cy-1792]|uniref:VOC family protein n=1 Tax=Chitinophaga sp. Cy-1792 TaxID=2608339 RepID=UPI00141FC3D8|nr:VOC family protein [Chitinophaga sp. Cy-1792]NIG54031.1 VOC family protein [Chitinophaga sp. Cy-1792]